MLQIKQHPVSSCSPVSA